MMKFKVGDRVEHDGHFATIMWIGDIDCIIRYDDHNLGWRITEEDHNSGYHTDLSIGSGYYYTDHHWIKFVSRPRKRSNKHISKAMEEADRAAIKEQAEQDEVIRLTREFCKTLKEHKV